MDNISRTENVVNIWREIKVVSRQQVYGLIDHLCRCVYCMYVYDSVQYSFWISPLLDWIIETNRIIEPIR